jgi:hypothetical protein
VAMAEDIKVWIAMDRIVSVEITDPEEDTLL